MEILYHVSPFTGYVYPNETILPWSALIVFYPYTTGLVAGAFVASSFYHVFGMQQFKPVARFALLMAFALMVFVPAFLLSHLGHPERAFTAMVTPNWTSAFSAFGFVASFYVFVLMLEIWFAFRADIVALAQGSSGVLRLFYRVLTLGSDDVSEKALRWDHQWTRALAIIGIPAACLLHGYVGFVFGSLKSREWWSSDLMPIIFLFSAAISGIALLIVLYVGVSAFRKVQTDQACMHSLARALWGFLVVTLVIETLERVSMFYRSREGIEGIVALMAGPIYPTLLVQAVGSVGAFIVLTWLILTDSRGKSLVRWLTVSSVLILVAVLAMRWNVIIGGQELSKTLKGYVTFVPPILGREGMLWTLTLFSGPFVFLWVLNRLLPTKELTPRPA